MIQGFWNTLPRPFLVLAPMADVTDPAYRRVIAELGKPDVMFSEFISCDGLCHPQARERLLHDVIFSLREKPIVLQLFTAQPEKMRKCAEMARLLGFDGVDINMGCPDKKVMKQGAGAALIRDPTRAQDLIKAAREGAGELPVSVKTRLGDTTDTLEDWLSSLLAAEPDAITIHLRTRKELSRVPAHWERARDAVLIRDALQSHTLIIGNGDVMSVEDGKKRAIETGLDGIMIGRAIFGNPWLFSNRSKSSIPLSEVLRTLKYHILLFEQLEGRYRSFSVMKKHFKSYIEGSSGAKEIRQRLMSSGTAKDAILIIDEVLAALK